MVYPVLFLAIADFLAKMLTAISNVIKTLPQMFLLCKIIDTIF